MLRKRLKLRIRGLLRRWRDQSQYRLVTGEEFGEEVDIASLICPLRYDIIVRAEFMAYYLANRDTYRRDVDEFLAHPVAQAYLASWTKDASRSRPEIAASQTLRNREFLVRMKRALALCEALERDGYDRSHRVELRTAAVIHHENHKRVEHRVYAGDGCHRIAFLLMHGETHLTPAQYQVRVYDEFSPRDNTFRLLGSVLRTEGDYCRFVSAFYCRGAKFAEAGELIGHVAKYHPERLDEVKSVIEVDLRQLAKISASSQATNSGSS